MIPGRIEKGGGGGGRDTLFPVVYISIIGFSFFLFQTARNISFIIEYILAVYQCIIVEYAYVYLYELIIFIQPKIIAVYLIILPQICVGTTAYCTHYTFTIAYNIISSIIVIIVIDDLLYVVERKL